MHFAQFVVLCEELAGTASRLAKVDCAARYFKALAGNEIRSGVAFLSGRSFPVSDPRTLDLGPAAFAQAREIAPNSSKDGSLTLTEVTDAFGRIAAASGKGSRQEKSAQLRQLVEQTNGSDRRVLFQLLHGELRIGIHDGLILEAIARASDSDLKSVRRAALFLSDLAEVAVVALNGGPGALDHVGIKLFVPLLPMLSELEEDLAAVIRLHGGRTALEYKYDGARVQIHKQGELVRVWSRRLTEVTASLPEIVGWVRRFDRVESLILDGEVVAMGSDGRPYPFQELMRRFRRVHGIEAAVNDIPLRLFLFDCLLIDGASLIDESYQSRWQQLTQLSGGDHLAARQLVSDAAEAETFLRAALAAGHEGIMAKSPNSPYMPGNRGKLWFKIKPAETIDCVIIAADRGSGRRRGWLSNYHLAVANGAGDFAPVGKTFKGLTDKQFTAMTERLQQLQLADDGGTVAVRPQVVVEVAYNEIQKSPQYSSGFALRFARIKRIREDKGPDQSTTLEALRALYEKQFATKSRRAV